MRAHIEERSQRASCSPQNDRSALKLDRDKVAFATDLVEDSDRVPGVLVQSLAFGLVAGLRMVRVRRKQLRKSFLMQKNEFSLNRIER